MDNAGLFLRATAVRGSMLPETVKQEWRDHWGVVVGTFFGMALAYPAFSFTQSQFMVPLQDEFGWTRAQISFAFHINLFVCFMAPVYD
jgi:cyanate permease